VYSPGCFAVDIRRQGGLLASFRDDRGRRPIIYLNPPFVMMAEILHVVEQFSLDVLLVHPLWPRHWLGHLKQLPRVGPTVTLTRPSNPNDPLFTAGTGADGVPAPVASNTSHNWAVAFCLIVWSDAARAAQDARRANRWSTD
jgi:hypothetical protein